MKAIEEYNNVELGQLFAQFFPDEIPELVGYIKTACIYQQEHEQELRADWKSGFITFDLWLSLAESVQRKLAKFGEKLHDNPELFGVHLFEGYHAIFTRDCILNFGNEKKEGTRIQAAANFLFDYFPTSCKQ